MAITPEKLFESLVLYQVEYNCRGKKLKNTEYGSTDYKSIKEILLGLSYVHGKGYSPDSIDIFDEANNYRIDYDIYRTGDNFNLFKDLDNYDINNPIFNAKPLLIDKIQKNFKYGKVLDIAIESDEFGRNGLELLALIAKRSNSLFKGITHRTIPNHLLDDYGIIINGSELKISFYNSTSTNIALAICFAFFTPTMLIPTPDLSGYALPSATPLIPGGMISATPRFTAPPPSFRKPQVSKLNDIKSTLQNIQRRIPKTNPEKLIEFVKDEYYIKKQKEFNHQREFVYGGSKKKGGAVLFKDSGHFFIINEIDPSLKAFDYFDYMLYGDTSLKNKYYEQAGFIFEQEILFSRLTKFSNITFLGAITVVNKDCSIIAALDDGEILLCLDGCLYNNKGKLSCSINILGQNGLEDIKFFYGPEKGHLSTHISSFAPSADAIIGLKVYSCKLEPFDATSAIIPKEEVYIDDAPQVNLLATGEYMVINDEVDNAPVVEKEIESIVTKSSNKAKRILTGAAKILQDMSDIVDEFVESCELLPKMADLAARRSCIILNKILGEEKKYEYGGTKISKITLIEKIAKIDPYIKGLSKMKKEKLLTIYNQLSVLNKYKKEELIKKYKVKGKNLKKCQIIDMIFNLSNK